MIFEYSITWIKLIAFFTLLCSFLLSISSTICSWYGDFYYQHAFDFNKSTVVATLNSKKAKKFFDPILKHKATIYEK